MKEIKLTKVIAPIFYDIHKDIKQKRHTYYWLKGGRGSGKSSFIALEIILGIMEDPYANAIVLRKVASNIKDSVFEQLWWAICQLGVEEYWEKKISIPQIVYKATGQKIIFRGGDDPRKLKSSKFPIGYGKFVWYEEVDEFANFAEIRSINQSLMRGGEEFVIFFSYNPPKSLKSWINQEVLEERHNKLVHHSTYLDMPEEWLGKTFFIEAEYVKEKMPDIYEHEYLGKAIGEGGQIFKNLILRNIMNDEIENFDRIARGLDWGYAVDPLHYTVNHFDQTRKRLYIFFEIQKQSMSNRRIAEEILKENIGKRTIVCDSAEPKSIAELCEYGLRCIGAKKGKDSVSFGMRWLRGLEEIVIDPNRCPHTAREFSSYEFESDGNDGYKDSYPDKNNHAIDAVRYSRQEDMMRVKVR